MKDDDCHSEISESEPLLRRPGKDSYVQDRLSNVGCVRRWLTVEPAMMLYFLAFIPLIPLTQQFVLHQVKSQMNLTEANGSLPVCQDNASSVVSDLENQAQSRASNIMISFNVVLFFPGFFATIILGSYSDQRGRKVGLLSPLLGGLVRCTCAVVVSSLNLPLEWMLLGLAFEGMSGGVATFIMAGFAYISDVTNHTQRSSRIFIVEVALGVGTVIAGLSTGFLIPLIGYSYCFVICACLHSVNALYVFFVVIETREKKPEARIFSTNHFVKIFKLYFTDTYDRQRWKLLLAILLLFIHCVIELGGSDNMTYFQIHQPLCFTSVMIGFWQAGNYIIRNIGGGLMVKFCNVRLGDTGLMLLNFVSGIIFYTLVAFTTTVVMMYSVSFASAWYSLLVPMSRSFISKQCSHDEQGTAFSGIAMTQTLAIVVGDVIFNSIYAATVHTHRGLVFMIDAACLSLGLMLTIVLIVCLRRETQAKPKPSIEHMVDGSAGGIY